MKVAILDLGTNTFNIFIADLLPSPSGREGWGGFQKIYKSKIPVKLGEGGINKNHIEEVPFKRGIRALQKHKKTADKFGAEKIVAFATSAVRSASNGKHFVQVAKEKTGIDIEIISGDREAEFIYYGVRSAVKMNDTPSLIIDIGGGSTEFIIATKKEIFWKQSFLLGAARLLEKFKPSDPITKEEIKQIENYLEENLQPLFTAFNQFSGALLPSPLEGNRAEERRLGAQPEGRGCELIGSSGSFDSLAEMIAYHYYTPEILKGKTEYDFNLEDCQKMYELILGSTTKERMHMPGLTKMRVDMIVISSVFVDYIMIRLGLKKMRLSKHSLKEGVLWELMNK